MKRFLLIFFCIAAVSGAAFYAVSVPRDTLAAAVGGVVDLREAGSALGKNVYALGGEWEFYWGRLYEPKDFISGGPLSGEPPEGSNKTLIPVPSSWNRHGYPRTGCATYRLALLAPVGAEVMLYVPEILSASAVWVNGEKVFSAGQAGADRDSFAPCAKSGIVALPGGGESGAGRFEIVVQASNFERINGGMRHPFRAGFGDLEENPLTRSFTGWLFMLAGVVGVFFFIGFCYVALFFLGRGDTHRGRLIYLVFAVSCLLTGLRFLVHNDGPAQFFLRNAALGSRLGGLYWIVTGLYCVSVVIFTLLAFELKPGRAVIRAIVVMLGLPFVLRLILPAPFNNFAALLFMLSFVVITVLTARSLSWERIRSRPYLGLYFISLLFFTLWGPLVNFPANAYFFAGYSLNSTFLTLAQFVMLSQEYTEARRRARELAARNDFYHKMAHDLLTPLTVVSTSVQVANMIPEKAPGLLKQSQAEIMKMAGMINDALEESRDGGGDE